VDITCISNNVLGKASQAMNCGVYLVQCVHCPTVPNSGVSASRFIAKRFYYIAFLNNDMFRSLYRPSSGCALSYY